MLWTAVFSALAAGNAVEVCPNRALQIMGEEKTISELLEIVKEDRTFYEQSGGGVTLGGGEVTMQPEAAISLLQACKLDGHQHRDRDLRLHEEGGPAADRRVCGPVPVRHQAVQFREEHSQWTGVRNERILDNLQELASPAV